MDNYPINLKLSRNIDNTKKNTINNTHRKSFSLSTVTKFSSLDTYRNTHNSKRNQTRRKTRMNTRMTFDSFRKSVYSPTFILPKEFNFLAHNYEYRKIIPLSKKMNKIPIKKKTFIKSSNKNTIIFTDRKRLKNEAEFLNFKFKSFHSLIEITKQDYYKKVYSSDKKKIKSKNLNIRTYFDKPKTKEKNLEEIKSKVKNFKIKKKTNKTKKKNNEKKKKLLENIELKERALTPRIVHSENFFIRLLESNLTNEIIKTLIRLKSIRWLWTHKKFILQKLIISFQTYKWFFEKNKLIEEEKFKEYLIVTSIGLDEDFSKQVFLIFQKSLKERKINFIEAICSFMVTSSNSFLHKINFILDALEDSFKKEISFNWLISLFKKIFHGKAYHRVIDNFSYSIFKKNHKSHDEVLYLKKEIILNELLNFSYTEKIFKHFLSNYLEIDKKLDDELFYAINNNLQKSNMILMSNMKINDFGIIYRFEKILESIKEYKLGIEEIKNMKKELNLNDQIEIKI